MTASPVRDKLEAALVASEVPSARAVFTRLMPEPARPEADAADARRKAGLSLGPLEGKIVSVKDLFDLAGQPTPAGSAMLRNAPAARQDAVVVARVRRAGAVIIGRTNMSEFAYSGLGLNPHYGTPGNAAAPDRAPGGSTRIPAAFNGIVGFKPTSTRIPKEGCFPLSHTLDSIGPLARTVADAAADAIMAGDEPSALPACDLAGLRIDVPRGLMFEAVEPEVLAASEAGLASLGRGGACIVDMSIDDLILAMREALAIGPIAACEAAQIHAGAVETMPEAFDRRVLSRIMLGYNIPAHGYIEAMQRRERLKPAFAARLGAYDCLALPTVAIRAPLIAPLEADDALFNAVNILALRNTNFGNFFDVPCLSLPLPVGGLPVGLMLLGASGADRPLFAVGAAVERRFATAWEGRATFVDRR